jgi:hypothetical protein
VLTNATHTLDTSMMCAYSDDNAPCPGAVLSVVFGSLLLVGDSGAPLVMADKETASADEYVLYGIMCGT